MALIYLNNELLDKQLYVVWSGLAIGEIQEGESRRMVVLQEDSHLPDDPLSEPWQLEASHVARIHPPEDFPYSLNSNLVVAQF